MKKRIIGLVLGTLALSLGAFLGVSNFNKKTEVASAYYTPSTHYNVSDTASELASYYSSISDSDTGTSLLSKLQSLNSTKRKRTMGYSGIGTDTSGAVIYTDYDLNSTAKDSNGQTYGTKVASFYTKTPATSWNREHMWPNSHGGNNVEADILHTRPTISSENSSRGNSFYVEGKNSSSAGWDPYTAGYDAEVRGECARVILYCVVAYPSFTLSDADSHSTSNSNKDNMMGNMNTLIKWHFDYAPNVYEMNRNNGAEYLQGNRNPFVDHPEYVAKIWSNFNSTVSSLCTSNASKYTGWEAGNYCNYGENTPVNNDGVTISSSSASIAVGSTTTLSATASNSGTISWTTSNSSVASISSSSSSSGANITVTGVSAGTATITAKATINGTQYSKTCTVTVTKVVSSLSKGSTSPTKTTYTAGESFDPTGLTITATYTDSTSSDVTSSVVWSPDPLTAGTTSVTGTFGGKTITITGLTVEAAQEPESYSIIPADLATSYPSSATSYTASSGINVTALNTANFSSKIQFKKSGGYLYNNDSLNLKTLTLTSVSGTLTVYAGTSKNPSSTTISGSNGVYNLSGYNYFKIINNSGSVATCTGITVGISSQQQTKTLSSISVSTAPTKTTYTAGEYFDPTGLVITRTYSDSTSDTYTYSGHTSEFTFSPSTSTALTTSNTSVTITYSGKTCSQAITVNAAKTLSSISVSTAPTKITYAAGETFDPTGLVITRTYSDSTSDTYTYSGHTSEFTFSPSTSTALTTSNVSVTITYGSKSTTQAITVNAAAKTLSSISVSGGKTSFTIDEDFSFGGTVTANFSDSSSSDVTASATFTGYNMSVAGNYTVTVSYTYGSTTKTATYSITVTSSGGSSTTTGSETIVMSEQGFSNTQSITTVNGESATVTFAQGSGSNSPKYYDSGSAVRVYPNNTITVSSEQTIISITIEFGSSDGSNSITSSPSGWTSPTWTGSSNSVTFTIGGTSGNRRIASITIEYESSGSSDPITSITASVSKTYYVGETINTSDIIVLDNNNKAVSGFTFANDGYQFTYSDASSGGASTSKTFTNAISYESLSCSLTVQIQRKAYQSPSASSLEHTGSEFASAGIGSSYTTSQSVKVDGITFTVDGYIYSSKLSLSSSKTSAPGKVQNTTPYPGGITGVTVTGASPDIQLSTDGNTWVDLSSATTSTTNYFYLKIFYKTTTQTSYVNITNITVSIKGVETANNVSNFIMYEDTNNQCASKLTTAINYINNCSSSELETLQNSSDYVISTARERLEAWARNQGKSIDYSSTGSVSLKAIKNTILTSDNCPFNNILIIICSISVISIFGIYLMIRKKGDNQ